MFSRPDSVVRPHTRHLMAEPPRLKRLDQAIEFDPCGAHLPLVVLEALLRVIGNRILILVHVSKHAQQSFPLRRAAFAKATVLHRRDQRGKQTAVLFNKMVAEIAVLKSFQLPQKVGWQTASRA